MRLAVLKERRASETRVAATPDTVKRLIGLGLTVAVEAGAGAVRRHPGRRVRRRRRRDRARCRPPRWPAPGIVFAVQMPLPEQRALIPRGALLVCIANAFADPDLVPRAGRRPASTAPRWSCCRASPARSRWTCCPARPTSPAIAR